MQRQYEKKDCLEDAVEGGEYEIAHALLSTGNGADVDRVGIFGCPTTRKVVWVPYGSEILVDGVKYTVIKGGPTRFPGDRPRKHNQSPECIQDEQGKIHGMYSMQNKMATITKLALQNIKRGR